MYQIFHQQRCVQQEILKISALQECSLAIFKSHYLEYLPIFWKCETAKVVIFVVMHQEIQGHAMQKLMVNLTSMILGKYCQAPWVMG